MTFYPSQKLVEGCVCVRVPFRVCVCVASSHHSTYVSFGRFGVIVLLRFWCDFSGSVCVGGYFTHETDLISLSVLYSSYAFWISINPMLWHCECNSNQSSISSFGQNQKNLLQFHVECVIHCWQLSIWSPVKKGKCVRMFVTCYQRTHKYPPLVVDQPPVRSLGGYSFFISMFRLVSCRTLHA